MALNEIPPAREQDLIDFAVPFVEQIKAAPTTVGLVAAQATEVDSLLQDAIARREAAVNPLTRTSGITQAKRTSLKALLAKLRELIRIVNAHPGLSNQQRADLGLRIPDEERTPVPPPLTRPLLSVDPDGMLRIVDESMPDQKGKLPGVAGALVFIKLDGEAPADVGQASFAMMMTRHRAAIPLPAGANKKTLWVLARWYNARGQLGPASLVVSTTIAA